MPGFEISEVDRYWDSDDEIKKFPSMVAFGERPRSGDPVCFAEVVEEQLCDVKWCGFHLVERICPSGVNDRLVFLVCLFLLLDVC